jgi:hypothetical protein
MKILARVSEDPPRYILIAIEGDTLKNSIRCLIRKGSYSRAILAALKKGDTIREVMQGDLAGEEADLILTAKRAHWDLMCRR